MNLLNLILGLLLSALIAALAYRRGSLSSSGVSGTIGVGMLIFAFGGLSWAILLIAFFVTSSALSHYKERAKEPLAEKFQKGHRRDLGQVLANGGLGALLALAYTVAPHPLWFVAFVGAMATVNADTWATELGVLANHAPRLITTGRIVPVGTSGGVTWLGTLVAFGGAFLIGGLASGLILFDAWFDPAAFIFYPLRLILIATFAGLGGALFDSFLGATVQAIYFCDRDQKETESAIHRCGERTRLIRGWRWLDNDWVNFTSSVVGALVAVIAYTALGF